jgi:hypothetical protein
MRSIPNGGRERRSDSSRHIRWSVGISQLGPTRLPDKETDLVVWAGGARPVSLDRVCQMGDVVLWSFAMLSVSDGSVVS